MNAGSQNTTLACIFRNIFYLPPLFSADDNRRALVKLAGDHRVLDEKLEGDDLEGVLVGGFEDDRAGSTGLLDLQPSGSTDAPAVAGFETGKAKLRHGRAEVVAKSLGGFKEGRIDDTADGVDTVVVGAGLTAAGAVEAGHRLTAADIQGLAKDVFPAIFDGFYGGHETPVRLQYPTFRREGEHPANTSAEIFHPAKGSTVVGLLLPERQGFACRREPGPPRTITYLISSV